MADLLRCPFCQDTLREEGGRDLRVCPTCDFAAPLHLVQFLAAERDELARLRRAMNHGPNGRPVDSGRLGQLVEDLRERALAADRAAKLADDQFDVPARDGYRGRALAYRHAARTAELLVGLNQPKKVGHG